MKRKNLFKKKIEPYAVITNEEKLTAEVNLYGEIVENRPTDWWTGERDDGLYIVEKEFLEDLDRLSIYEDITFRINSIGGDAFAGVAIYNRIREMNAQTTTIVDGIAASAASIVFLAGDRRLMGEGSQIMIHEASAFTYGWYNKTDLKQIMNALDGTDRALREIYTSRTGLNPDTIAKMVTKTTWLTGKEAVEKGFAHELTQEEAKIENKKDSLVVNGIPHRIAAAYRPQLETLYGVGGDEPIDIDDHYTGKESNDMTLEELKAQHPELVKAISDEVVALAQSEKDEAVKAAIKSERDRIREIEGIQGNIMDKTMVEEAKYGDNPMNAQELAFKAMQNEASTGKAALNALAADAAHSGAEGVQTDPAGDPETEIKDAMVEHMREVSDKVIAARSGR